MLLSLRSDRRRKPWRAQALTARWRTLHQQLHPFLLMQQHHALACLQWLVLLQWGHYLQVRWTGLRFLALLVTRANVSCTALRSKGDRVELCLTVSWRPRLPPSADCYGRHRLVGRCPGADL
jgi:hypothetical protein